MTKPLSRAVRGFHRPATWSRRCSIAAKRSRPSTSSLPPRHQIRPGVGLVVACHLRELRWCHAAVKGCDTVYHLAADMGGMGFIEANKAACALNVLIDAHMLLAARDAGVSRYLYASTACVYRLTGKTLRTRHRCGNVRTCTRRTRGWWLCLGQALRRASRPPLPRRTTASRPGSRACTQSSARTVLGRGPGEGPAALCRKVAVAKRDGSREIEIWGDGQQARSFLYVDDAIEAIRLLAASDCREPLNVGSDELVAVNELAAMIEGIAGVELAHRYVPGPLGVRGRSSDNALIGEMLGWKPRIPLRDGVAATYEWIMLRLGRM